MAIMVQNYTKFRNEKIGFDVLSESQKEWITIKNNIKVLKPIIDVKHETGIKSYAYKLLKNKAYKHFIYIVIVVNVINLAFKWHRLIKYSFFLYNL